MQLTSDDVQQSFVVIAKDHVGGAVTHAARQICNVWSIIVNDDWQVRLAAAPFSRGVYVWGAPIEIPKDGDDTAREAARLLVEDRLNAVTFEADRLVGQSAIEPQREPQIETKP